MAELISIVVGLCLAGIGVGGIALWLIAKPLHVRVGLLRAIAVIALGSIATVAFELAALFVLPFFPSLGAAVAALVVGIILGIALLKYFLATTKGKAVLAWMVVTVAQLSFAMLLRAVWLEAFLIPTGSKAPAVIGEHHDVDCANCGRSFVVDATRGIHSPRPLEAVCVNCLAKTTVDPRTKPLSGDRILVDKTRLPSRWDLTIFRSPQRLDTKYLGRIVGLPGETVELASGDVFINGVREAKAADQLNLMWVLVNDTVHSIKTPDANEPGWRPAQETSQWKSREGEWEIDAGDADELVFDRQITDRSEYNSMHGSPPRTVVVDVRLDVRVESFEGEGNLALIWRCGEREVVAQFDRSGNAVLKYGDRSEESSDVPAALSAGARLGLAVRDGIASLLIADRVVASLEIDSPKVEDHRSHDEQATQSCRLSIRASKAKTKVDRLVVRRDVYFHGDMGVCAGCTNAPFTLGPREYFSLGDNSRFSADSRSWSELDPALAGRYQIGAVPEEAIIGVARWMYWPLNHARPLD